MGLGSRLLYEDVEIAPMTPGGGGASKARSGKRIKDMTLDEYDQAFASVNKIGSGA